MGRVRKQSKGRRVIREETGLGRAVPLMPMREKLVFRCNVDKTKPNKKQSKKIKIHKVGEGTRGRRIQIDMKKRKYIKYMDEFHTKVQPILNSNC